MTTTVKFVQLSPATTTLLSSRLAGARVAGHPLPVEIKQTVATFQLEPGLVMQLLDGLIQDEIPGAGPSGKNVKLLREVRRRLRDALNGMDAAHSKVQITTELPVDPLREKILDLVTRICWRVENDDDAYDEVGELVDLSGRVPGEQMATSDREQLRTWLDEHL